MIMHKTAAAIRQRRHRDRRHRGFTCVTVEIGADDIGGLIDRGLLDRMHQDDPDQVQRALHAFFDRTLARSSTP
jgi:hypothetical protein